MRRIPRELRMCHLCNKELADGFHYLLSCKYRVVYYEISGRGPSIVNQLSNIKFVMLQYFPFHLISRCFRYLQKTGSPSVVKYF